MKESLLKRYVLRATDEFSMANVARRACEGQVGQNNVFLFWQRIENNRRKGISRAIRRLDKIAGHIWE